MMHVAAQRRALHARAARWSFSANSSMTAMVVNYLNGTNTLWQSWMDAEVVKSLTCCHRLSHGWSSRKIMHRCALYMTYAAM